MRESILHHHHNSNKLHRQSKQELRNERSMGNIHGSTPVVPPAFPVAIIGNGGEWEGPYPMPIVAAAAANLPDGRILAWSAYAKMNFGGNNGETWTAMFDPTSKQSSQELIVNTGHDMFCPGTGAFVDRFWVSHPLCQKNSLPCGCYYYDYRRILCWEDNHLRSARRQVDLW